MRAIIIVLFSLLMASGIVNAASSSYQTIDQVIAERGQPDTITPGTRGNTLYTYISRGVETIPDQVSPNPTIFVGPKGQSISAGVPSAYSRKVPYTKCTTVFEVNAKRMVVSEKNYGPHCSR